MGCKETPVSQYQMKVRKFEAFANENNGNPVVDVAIGRIKRAYESWNARQSSDDNDKRFMCNLDDIKHYQSHKLSNPIIRFGELNEREVKDLHARMNELTEEINREFLKFQNQMLDAIKGKVNRDNLIVTLHRMIHFTGKEATEVEVFLKLLEYCSYFNYGPLETIVKVHNLDEGPLEIYLSAFSLYCKAMPCVETVCGDVTPTPERYTVEFKVKGEHNKFKPDTIESITRKIAGHLGINYSALYLHFIKNGCISLEYLVPDFIVESSFSFCNDKQMIALYTEISVISVTIHYPYGVKTVEVEAEAKHLLKSAQVTDTRSIEQEQSSPEPDPLQQLVPVSRQPITIPDVHGKKPEIHEVVKQMHKLNITELAHIGKKEAEKTGKLEPEEICQRLKMIYQEIKKVNEELSKAWHELDLDHLKEKKEEETRGFIQDEIKQKLKIAQQVEENVNQELQDIWLWLSNLQTIERVLQLAEEGLQLLQNGEFQSKPIKEFQKELWKVHLELEEVIWKRRRELSIQELWNIRMKLKDLYKIMKNLQENMMALYEVDDLHHKITQKISLITDFFYGPHYDMLKEAHVIIRQLINFFSLEQEEREGKIMRDEEDFQKMSIQRKEKEVQSKGHVIEKKEETVKLLGHHSLATKDLSSEYPLFKESLDEYQQRVKEMKRRFSIVKTRMAVVEVKRCETHKTKTEEQTAKMIGQAMKKKKAVKKELAVMSKPWKWTPSRGRTKSEFHSLHSRRYATLSHGLRRSTMPSAKMRIRRHTVEKRVVTAHTYSGHWLPMIHIIWSKQRRQQVEEEKCEEYHHQEREKVEEELQKMKQAQREKAVRQKSRDEQEHQRQLERDKREVTRKF